MFYVLRWIVTAPPRSLKVTNNNQAAAVYKTASSEATVSYTNWYKYSIKKVDGRRWTLF